MIQIFAKIGEIASKVTEKLSQSSMETKEKVSCLDKPLNNTNLETKETATDAKTLLSDLDKPLNENVKVYDESGFRLLTEEEKQNLRDTTNWPDKPEGIQGCKINDEGVIKYPCRNESYAGTTNPLTGVEYEKKIVDINGNKVEVVTPKFESVFDAELSNDLCEAKDREQFKECNKQLYDAIQNSPELSKKFTSEQIEQIKDGINNGSSPEGYTWHHDVEKGKIQLVDSDVHADSRHTGGKTLWGGGNDNR